MAPRPARPDEPIGPPAVCILAYEAAATIGEVIERTRAHAPGGALVLVADDASHDATRRLAQEAIDEVPWPQAEVVTHPANLGYGGNQVACIRWALERGAGSVAFLHGDAQYPPEALGALLAPIHDGSADAVFGSRMLEPGAARAGGMPLGRFVGNRALSRIQNALTGADLSEWHSGLRAYRLDVLADLDPWTLPVGFDIDTEATLRLLDAGARIAEIPIPTRYAGETSRLRPAADGARILRRTLAHRRGEPVEVAS